MNAFSLISAMEFSSNDEFRYDAATLHVGDMTLAIRDATLPPTFGFENPQIVSRLGDVYFEISFDIKLSPEVYITGVRTVVILDVTDMLTKLLATDSSTSMIMTPSGVKQPYTLYLDTYDSVSTAHIDEIVKKHPRYYTRIMITGPERADHVIEDIFAKWRNYQHIAHYAEVVFINAYTEATRVAVRRALGRQT